MTVIRNKKNYKETIEKLIELSDRKHIIEERKALQSRSPSESNWGSHRIKTEWATNSYKKLYCEYIFQYYSESSIT